jgi:hypothetical protein
MLSGNENIVAFMPSKGSNKLPPSGGSFILMIMIKSRIKKLRTKITFFTLLCICDNSIYFGIEVLAC